MAEQTPARFSMVAVWTVEDPAGGPGLAPITPGRMSRVFRAVLQRLVDDDLESQAKVGAVSVTCQQMPPPTSRRPEDQPGVDAGKTVEHDW